MRYHEKYNKVIEDYKNKLITKKEACGKIIQIEEWAYKVLPYSEPDGDITYAAHMALDEIRKENSGKELYKLSMWQST